MTRGPTTCPRADDGFVEMYVGSGLDADVALLTPKKIVEEVLEDCRVCIALARERRDAEQAAARAALPADERAENEDEPEAVPPLEPSPLMGVLLNGTRRDPRLRADFLRAFETAGSTDTSKRKGRLVQSLQVLQAFERCRRTRDDDLRSQDRKVFTDGAQGSPYRRVIESRTDWNAAAARVDRLHPHFAAVTTFVGRHVCASLQSRVPQRLAPPLLLGAADIGKSRYERDLAQTLDIPLRTQSMENAQTTALMLGTERHRFTSTPGVIFETIVLGDVAIPMILIEELDKAATFAQHDPLLALHSMLEPHTASVVRDACGDFFFDASLAFFAATANESKRISESLLSRFKVFALSQSRGAAALQVAQGVASSVIDELGIPDFEPPPHAWTREVAHLTARKVYQCVHEAAATATSEGPRHLVLRDLPASNLGEHFAGARLLPDAPAAPGRLTAIELNVHATLLAVPPPLL